MIIRDMFADDINRKINGVIKVDQAADDVIEQELNEYLCEIIETDIAAESVDSDYYRSQTATKRSKNKPYMKLKLLCELSGRGLSLSELLERGLKTVQCTTEASDELKNYLASAIRRNGNGDTNKR